MEERKKHSLIFKYDRDGDAMDTTSLGEIIILLCMATVVALLVLVAIFCFKAMDIYFLKQKLEAFSSIANSPDVMSVAKGASAEFTKVITDIIGALKEINK